MAGGRRSATFGETCPSEPWEADDLTGPLRALATALKLEAARCPADGLPGSCRACMHVAAIFALLFSTFISLYSSADASRGQR